MDSVSPVYCEEAIPSELVIALDQEEYIPLIVLPVLFDGGKVGMAVRFKLSDEERLKIAGGCDLVITELTGGRQFTPISVIICRPNEAPEF